MCGFKLLVRARGRIMLGEMVHVFCASDFPDIPCMKKVKKKRQHSTGQQPNKERPSSCRNTGDKQVMNRL